ncbi:MAG: YdcF family protein [Bacteroidota bacterium]
MTLLFSNSFITSEVYRLWNYEVKNEKEISNYEIGIVLSGMANYDKETKVLHINRSADRLWQALNLYHSKKIKKILISGDNGYITDKGLHEAEQFKAVLVKWGIPAEDILTESISRNTAENAIETKKLLKKLNFHPTISKKALLITSGLHMRRSKAVFDKVGLPVDCYPVDGAKSKKRGYYLYQIIVPNFDNFLGWTELMKEIIGYIVYDCKGYI